MIYFEYSSKHRISMPICEIMMGREGEVANFGPFEALLDTGADFTIVPLQYLEDIGAQITGFDIAKGVWGEEREVEIYGMSLSLSNKRFNAIEVIADEIGEEVILGRNILNWLRITFDGPAQYVEISE
jgi:predicted aspartyl protease